MDNERTYWFVRSPKLSVSLVILLTVALAWFVQYFRIDASADTLLVKDNELYIQTQVMNQRFSPDEFILLAYQPKQHQVFSQKTFTDLQALSEKIEALPRVRAVTHILNVPLLSQMTQLDPNLDPKQWTWQAKQYSFEEMR